MTVLTLAKSLIACPSVTPIEGGALDLVESWLKPLGFKTMRKVFQEEGTDAVDNLYARLGDQAPNLCFAGHSDVVPPGRLEAWDSPPFAPEVRDGMLYGRGAEDMKGAVAAFVDAVQKTLADAPPKGSISLLITADEEGPGINGTKPMLSWLKEQGELIDHCIVGEPTNPEKMGEMIKVGRRGSINSVLTIHGTQGHVAYPHKAENPIPRLLNVLAKLTDGPIDTGSIYFPPSNLEVTSIDVGNMIDNVIPAHASAKFNIRFNDHWTPDSIQTWIREKCESVKGEYELHMKVSGESFQNTDERLARLMSLAVEEVTQQKPVLSTTGGTSDARFIKDFCPVIEFGTTGPTAHKVNECVAVEALEQLSDVYASFIQKYFA